MKIPWRGMSVAVVLSAAIAQAQTQHPAFRFEFRHPQLNPTYYSIALLADGSGQYHAESLANQQAEPVDIAIHVSPDLLKQMHQVAEAHHWFATRCDSGKSGIAFQGSKTLEYEGPEGRGSCTFNWSPDHGIQQLANTLAAVGETLQYGLRLKREQRYDRLALDADLRALEKDAAAGRVLELGNIAGILTGIAEDPAVMDRARRKAKQLLLLLHSPDAPAAE